MSAMYEELARMRLRETLDPSRATASRRTVRGRREFRWQWWRRRRPAGVASAGVATAVVVTTGSAVADQRDAA